MQQSSTGTARAPSRVMTERAFGVPAAGQYHGGHQHLAQNEDDADGRQVGRPADAEERDVGGQVVAARADGHEGAGGERSTHRPLRRRPPDPPRPCAGFRGPLPPGPTSAAARPARAPRWSAAPARASPTTLGENSKRTAAAAAARTTRRTKPATWPAAMRRARSSGAPATIVMVTTQLSMLVPTKAAAAMPKSAPRPVTATRGGIRRPAAAAWPDRTACRPAA